MAAPTAAAAPAGRQHAVARLKARFPCREDAIDLLEAELCSSVPGANCLVYGPAASGKTAVTRALLRALRVRHAYINCNEASRTRPLLSSVLHQLKGGKRLRDDGYECGAKCDSIADFLLQLPAAVGRRQGPCWLVLDNAQRLAGSDLLSALMRAREETGAELALLMVAGQGWSSGAYLRDTANVLPPKEVHFGAYTPPQLQQILEHRRQQVEGDTGDAPAFRQFLALFVPAFCRASNNLLDLQAAVAHLFPLYIQPLHEGSQLQAAGLYVRIKSKVQQCIQGLEVQPGGAAALAAADPVPAPDASSGAAEGKQLRTAAGRRACSSGLAFELPFISKFLLLAAYIASRNKPTADRAVFDPGFKKRGRKDAQALDRQHEAAIEAKLRGPHSFPLERLLHIFYHIYAHHDAEDAEEDEGSGGAQQQEAQRVMQQAEVLQQVSSLVQLRQLEQGSGDVLEGQLYRCNLGDDMAEALAKNVQLELRNYLKMA